VGAGGDCGRGQVLGEMELHAPPVRPIPNPPKASNPFVPSTGGSASARVPMATPVSAPYPGTAAGAGLGPRAGGVGAGAGAGAGTGAGRPASVAVAMPAGGGGGGSGGGGGGGGGGGDEESISKEGRLVYTVWARNVGPAAFLFWGWGDGGGGRARTGAPPCHHKHCSPPRLSYLPPLLWTDGRGLHFFPDHLRSVRPPVG
jgi:hypothetical protein